MSRIIALLFTTLLMVSVTTTAHAELETYEIDKRHTNILWFGSHFGFSNSVGQFMDFEGEINFDQDNPAQSSVDVLIKTESIMTGLPKFDAHLKNEDFFDVEEYPEVTFKSTNIEITGDNTADITGDLTLMGVTKPVTLKTTLNKAGVNPHNKKKTIGLRAETEIARADFGMDRMVENGIAPIIPIVIELEAVKPEEGQ